MSDLSKQTQHSRLYMSISCVSNLLSGDGGLSGLEVSGHVFIVHLYMLYSSSLHVVSTSVHVLHICMLYTCVCCTPVHICCTHVLFVHLYIYVVHTYFLYTCMHMV